MPIIAQAREFLGKSGSDRMASSHRVPPHKSDIENFLHKAVGYVLIVDEKVAGFCAIITGEDTQYTKIYNGEWLNDSLDYVTVHCLALSDQYRGLGLTKYLFKHLYSDASTRI